MVQEELAEIIAAEHNLSMAASKNIVRTVLSTIVDTVAKGETVSFAGFGSFVPVYAKARTGHHIKSREPIKIAATVKPKFTPGNTFKRIVSASAALQDKLNGPDDHTDKSQ